MPELIDLSNDRLIGWPEIQEFTKVERRTLIKYAKEFNLPLMRTPSNRPVLYKSLFTEWEKRANMKKN